jgi:hypothetical protein
MGEIQAFVHEDAGGWDAGILDQSCEVPEGEKSKKGLY